MDAPACISLEYGETPLSCAHATSCMARSVAVRQRALVWVPGVSTCRWCRRCRHAESRAASRCRPSRRAASPAGSRCRLTPRAPSPRLGGRPPCCRRSTAVGPAQQHDGDCLGKHTLGALQDAPGYFELARITVAQRAGFSACQAAHVTHQAAEAHPGLVGRRRHAMEPLAVQPARRSDDSWLLLVCVMLHSRCGESPANLMTFPLVPLTSPHQRRHAPP